jgi:hypothetical protein
MAKFHVNNSGEAGQCRATQGGCPFGGDAQHYETPEVARQAFELSMAASQLPTVAKKLTKAEAASASAKEAFFPASYGGHSYEEIVFDEEAIRAKWRARHRQNAKVSRLRLDDLEDHVGNDTRREKKIWETAARTEPAKSYDKNVPIRLIPVGTEVEVYDSRRRGYLYKTVGTPVDNGDGHVVGKYRDVANEWDYVEPNTTFNLGPVPGNKKISPRWHAANQKAASLKAMREQYKQDQEAAGKTKK